MSREQSVEARDVRDAVTVVSAYGAFRLLLGLLAVWSFFAGFALLTQALGQLSFGGQEEAAERVIGAHMIMLAPVYGLIAWRRSDYRLLIWIPYAAQLAFIIPLSWELLSDGETDGALLLVVSIIFLALLVYVWTSSRPLAFFQPEDSEMDGDDDGEPMSAQSLDEASSRARRYRRSE